MEKGICVFCSSASEIDQAHFDDATDFSQWLADKSQPLVYGGAKVGLMGHFADQTLKRGGEVYGVLPVCLTQKEVKHTGLTEIEVVPDLFERKRRMIDYSKAFVTFPGGIGTLDELLEVLTWKVLDQLSQPIFLYNPNGFWDPFLSTLDHLTKAGMLDSKAVSHMTICDDMESLLSSLGSQLANDF